MQISCHKQVSIYHKFLSGEALKCLARLVSKNAILLVTVPMPPACTGKHPTERLVQIFWVSQYFNPRVGCSEPRACGLCGVGTTADLRDARLCLWLCPAPLWCFLGEPSLPQQPIVRAKRPLGSPGSLLGCAGLPCFLPQCCMQESRKNAATPFLAVNKTGDAGSPAAASGSTAATAFAHSAADHPRRLLLTYAHALLCSRIFSRKQPWLARRSASMTASGC